MLEPQTLRILADNGHPLDITTEEHSRYHHTVHVKDRGSFTSRGYLDTDLLQTHLASDLQFYPREVRINGQQIQRTTFPDLPRVTVTSHHNHTDFYPNTKTVPLVPGYGLHQSHNALIAGVLTKMHHPAKPANYFTPGPSSFPHWQPALKVSITPVSVVTAEELSKLSDTEINLLMSRQSILPLTKTLEARDAEQVQRALDHANAPPRYDGPIHHYALTHPDLHRTSEFFRQGEPIIARGTPVAIQPECLSNPEFISLAEALYNHDQDLVPVQPGDNPRRAVTDIELAKDQSTSDKSSCLQKVPSMTLSLGLDGQPPDRKIPVHLWMTYDDLTESIDRIFHTARNNLTQEYLTDCLIRAFWVDTNSVNRDRDEDRMAQFAFDMTCLAKAALEDPGEAYRQKLQQYLDDFTTDLPAPDVEITVTSSNQNLSMVYRPPA